MDARQQLVAQYVIQQMYEKALIELVNIMDIDPAYNENYAQKSMLKIFNILANDHELVTKFRPSLRRYAH